MDQRVETLQKNYAELAAVSQSVIDNVAKKSGDVKAVRSAQDQVVTLLSEVGKLLQSAAVMATQLSSPKRLPGGIATSLALRTLVLLMAARLGMARVMKVVLSLVVFTLLPGAYEAHRAGTKGELHNQAVVAPAQMADSMKKNLTDSNPNQSSIIGQLSSIVKEAPEMGKELYGLAVAYWKVGTRVIRLASTAVPMLVKSGKTWQEVLKSTVNMVRLFQRMSKG